MVNYIGLICIAFQAAELAIKFLGQERATTVVEIVCPRLTELRRFSAVSMAFETA